MKNKFGKSGGPGLWPSKWLRLYGFLGKSRGIPSFTSKMGQLGGWQFAKMKKHDWFLLSNWMDPVNVLRYRYRNLGKDRCSLECQWGIVHDLKWSNVQNPLCTVGIPDILGSIPPYNHQPTGFFELCSVLDTVNTVNLPMGDFPLWSLKKRWCPTWCIGISLTCWLRTRLLK